MQADSLNSRYEQNLLRFIDGWRGEYEFHQDIDEQLLADNNGLRTAMPPQVSNYPSVFLNGDKRQHVRVFVADQAVLVILGTFRIVVQIAW